MTTPDPFRNNLFVHIPRGIPPSLKPKGRRFFYFLLDSFRYKKALMFLQTSVINYYLMNFIHNPLLR